MDIEFIRIFKKMLCGKIIKADSIDL